MGMKIRMNTAHIEATVLQVGVRAEKGVSDRMRKIAVRIRDLARQYAPVKTGLLERNIEYGTYKEKGRNVYTVFIDLDAARESGVGVLGDYANVMEKTLRPFGNQGRPLYLGIGSLLKAASTGKRVGGRFLSRAVTEGSKNILGECVAEVLRVTGGTRVATMKYQPESGGDNE